MPDKSPIGTTIGGNFGCLRFKIGQFLFKLVDARQVTDRYDERWDFDLTKFGSKGCEFLLKFIDARRIPDRNDERWDFA